MSDETALAPSRANPLDDIFDESLVRVAVLNRHGDPTGVVGVFKAISPNVKSNYDRIIQKGFGGRKPKYDDGDRYVFPKIIQEIEGLTAEDCGGLEPIRFCMTPGKGFQLLKILMNGFWSLTLTSTEEDDDQKKLQPQP